MEKKKVEPTTTSPGLTCAFTEYTTGVLKKLQASITVRRLPGTSGTRKKSDFQSMVKLNLLATRYGDQVVEPS